MTPQLNGLKKNPTIYLLMILQAGDLDRAQPEKSLLCNVVSAGRIDALALSC